MFCQGKSTVLPSPVMAGLVQVKVGVPGKPVRQGIVAPADMVGLEQAGGVRFHQFGHLAVAGAGGFAFEICVADDDSHRRKFPGILADGTYHRFHAGCWHHVLRKNPGGSGIRHIVAPHHRQRQSTPFFLFPWGAVHSFGMDEIGQVWPGKVVTDAVRGSKGMTVLGSAASVTLGQGEQMQHRKALFGPQVQVILLLPVGNAGKSAPAGIGRPEERGSVPQQGVPVREGGDRAMHNVFLSPDPRRWWQ